MIPKNAVALGAVFVLITTIFLPMPSTSVISDSKGSETVSIRDGEPTSEPKNVTATKSGSDIILNWTAVADATGYNIYRSTNVNGTGLAYYTESATNSYTDTGALADSNNYSYVVKSKNVAGENTTASNIAFKLRFFFKYNAGSTSMNMFSLPYNTTLTNASTLKTDIGATCSVVRKWLPEPQMWQAYPPAPGNFAITPGAGYMTVVTADTWYFIVGSHNKSTTHTFKYNASSTSMNMFSLPYHTTLTDAYTLKTSIGATCSVVRKWLPASQAWQPYPPIAAKFVITPGAGYMAVVTADTTWQAPSNDP